MSERVHSRARTHVVLAASSRAAGRRLAGASLAPAAAAAPDAAQIDDVPRAARLADDRHRRHLRRRGPGARRRPRLPRRHRRRRDQLRRSSTRRTATSARTTPSTGSTAPRGRRATSPRGTRPSAASPRAWPATCTTAPASTRSSAIAPRYCPDGTGNWVANVTAFMTQLGGDPADTASSRAASAAPARHRSPGSSRSTARSSWPAAPARSASDVRVRFTHRPTAAVSRSPSTGSGWPCAAPPAPCADLVSDQRAHAGAGSAARRHGVVAARPRPAAGTAGSRWCATARPASSASKQAFAFRVSLARDLSCAAGSGRRRRSTLAATGASRTLVRGRASLRTGSRGTGSACSAPAARRRAAAPAAARSAAWAAA